MNSEAAWQRQPGEPLSIGPVEVPAPARGEILVRNEAVAINPLDYLLQDMAMLPWLSYPAIVGSDVAGTVIAVGEGVDRFASGDRVLGQAVGTTFNQPAHGAFQRHTIVLAHMAAPIPDDMAAVEAAVLPLGIGTAAVGLYQADQLALDPPSLSPSDKGIALLVWGASSSVGCNAVQLARASGYEVIATASPRNAALVERLGAGVVIDHNDPEVIDRVVAALDGKAMVGAFHATGDLAATAEVVRRSQGRRFITVTLPPQIELPESVKANAIFGTSLRDNEVGPMIYENFLPSALAAGRYVAAPRPRVVGHGLEAFQAGVEAQRAGISGHKLVVDLQ